MLVRTHQIQKNSKTARHTRLQQEIESVIGASLGKRTPRKMKIKRTITPYRMPPGAVKMQIRKMRWRRRVMTEVTTTFKQLPDLPINEQEEVVWTVLYEKADDLHDTMEHGFDTQMVLAKKMACWLDIENLDPMLTGEGIKLLGTIGEVFRTAGTTKDGDGKLAHICGCVLLDLSKPLPTVLKMILNGTS
ncbi:hypothetical protein R1sor_018446 [Riccia sorocarpa]|uniref:Uncharacterized protein n=1 Tax=Riccia sorocarpa TaxID=122646 RepID=A0ABD3ID03_9MARC